MRIRTTAATTIVVAVLGLTGCGSNGQPSPAPNQQTPPTPITQTTQPSEPTTSPSQPADCAKQPYAVSLCLTFAITGDETLNGTISINAPSTQSPETCAEWATDKGFINGHFALGLFSKTIDGKLVDTQFEIEGVKGPGSYPQSGGGPGYVRIGDRGFLQQSTTTVQLDFAADGSGKLSFEKLGHSPGIEDETDARISGSITWSCLDPA